MNILFSVPLTIIASDIHNTNQVWTLCTPETVILCFALNLEHSNKIFALKTAKGIIHNGILARDKQVYFMFMLQDIDVQYV